MKQVLFQYLQQPSPAEDDVGMWRWFACFVLDVTMHIIIWVCTKDLGFEPGSALARLIDA